MVLRSLSGSARFLNLRRFSKNRFLEVLVHLKTSAKGLSSKELGDALDLTHVAARAQAEELVEKGFLTTRKRPKAIGRPEQAYLLTEKSHEMFPDLSTELCLDILLQANLSEANAAERLLFATFRRKADRLANELAALPFSERVEALLKHRRAEGRMSQLVEKSDQVFIIEEYHDPLQEIMRKYPTLAKMDEDLVERALHVNKVDRACEQNGEHYRIRFVIPAVA